ncbi:rhodanese-like domain-containing protein [Sinisalibacter aestuarii]|uniref:Rhodanese n=1 Tax=Sinisalibacter aestuarii TaxID=2949426 RepID=A0ABQ5LY54_9RHOB|nr:rhodanese-like domain-containing protein [Sinisalibacter aestuarii]GKY89892.1 rhodanese [Sinisalibacter aestuarii]
MSTNRVLKISSADMVARARARITEIGAIEAVHLHGDPGVIFVDIRDIRERQRQGFIPGSIHAPRGMLEFWFDPASPYARSELMTDKTYILHCASGWRSALAASTLLDMGLEVAHIREGFSGWVESKGPVEHPIDRRNA